MTNAEEYDGLTAATRAVALGRPKRIAGAAVNVPVSFTSTYVADGDVSYARTSNPTWEALEEVLGSLEGGSARVFGSGLAAVSAVISLVPVGGVVVAPRHAYNGTTGILGERSAAGALTVRPVQADDVEGIVAACAGADLLLLESPTNPMMELTDVPAVLRGLADRYGDQRPVVVCDNTFATPLVQQPLSWGVDAVIHSATKYLAGHSDVLLGAVVVSPQRADLAERLHTHRTLHGAIPGPMEAWLVLRGIRTLSVRLERATATARVIAERLREHPVVVRVRYPGFGAMLSIEVGSEEAAETVCARTRLWMHSTSLGGVESQIERRRRHPLEVDTVPVDLIRLSVGIEDVEDLWADLEQALAPEAPAP
ncbi:trans-sulfuration enzyme family protein [Ornithinimicrobium pratense]|uniref:PLP-dependent transferase n=1 Tax=Ornithinimicrobium pratense TaxID=2593973 RepID=A0A5J6V8Y5_9MICO|nr:PLP-dependent aspartate aminotransferase family protein [Ornithinimicrobium pratense]QFG69834.1 PLP-dependent transferase [Ornithinimicrobium pratense]